MRPLYEVRLEAFEGPLDLLLFFIQRDELNIWDIPIERITHQFLEYMAALEELDLELASEFLYVAAMLLEIKTRMLLPQQASDPGAIAAEAPQPDPRQELAERLVRYQRFKAAAAELESLRMRAGFPRGRSTQDRTQPEGLPDTLTLYQLLEALQRLQRRRQPDAHSVERWPTSVERQAQWLLERVRRRGQTRFRDLLLELPGRMWVVMTFLALLELVLQGQLRLVLEQDPEEFSLKLAETASELLAHA
ncbi:MAG: segregation/condensation protein A [Bacteroidetes bacterium]|nr:segregation/condensation protein A [Rhodothermia bacterium]MCS7154298.1 segregation/condensation protein A [Bacteroidota bacterium]MCX7906666.1 segregation/condensation protein A [Bacteroidota bacterium]MDW8137054.1 segregation/condensation protein A [Bacteroidota bacterium]MDW8285075.1 segregation/condensation protein A [Bacteroidota bacterium]